MDGAIITFLRRHWLRITVVAVVTASMILAYGRMIPVWIFYTLLIGMHVWIFTLIGIRIWNRCAGKKE